MREREGVRVDPVICDVVVEGDWWLGDGSWTVLCFHPVFLVLNMGNPSCASGAVLLYFINMLSTFPDSQLPLGSSTSIAEFPRDAWELSPPGSALLWVQQVALAPWSLRLLTWGDPTPRGVSSLPRRPFIMTCDPYAKAAFWFVFV